MNEKAQVSVEFLVILAGAILVATVAGLALKSIQTGQISNLTQVSNQNP